MSIHSQTLRSVLRIAIFAGVLLTACSTPQPKTGTVSPLSANPPSPLSTPQSEKPAAPAEAPLPIAGKASISGLLLSSRSGTVIPDTMFYLTPAVGPDKRSMPSILIGPEESQGDIRGKSDASGTFTLNGIPPGNYFLIVWSPYNWPEADISATDPTPRLIELKAQQAEPLGAVYAGWP